MTHGIASTKGHLANNGGLRGHSVGEEFPYIVVAKGNPHDGAIEWYVQDPAGDVWDNLPQATAHSAGLLAVAFKKQGAYVNNKAA